MPESSGVEPSARARGLLWTHNDSGWDAELFAVDLSGRLVGRVRVRGARNVDWEDLARGPCGEEACLYLADTGDNLLDRGELMVYRLPEPAPDAGRAGPPEAFPVVLPDGPRDIEALYVLPGERLYFATKGRAGPVELYRYPPPLREGEPVTLERVQRLSGRRPLLPSMVTGAAATPDGSLVAIRTYEALRFYRPSSQRPGEEGAPLVQEGTLEEVEGARVNLRPLRERQGEGVAFAPEGRVLLTSEAGPGGGRGSLHVLRCRIPGHTW